MKNLNFFSIAFLGIFFFAFINIYDTSREDAAYNYADDYQYSITNCKLEEKFENQFSNLISKVIQIDVHYNLTNDFYYVVHGLDIDDSPIIEYFKTTGYEVKNEIYNYISKEESAYCHVPGGHACREDWFSPNGWCHPNNNGPICGCTNGPFGPCVYY